MTNYARAPKRPTNCPNCGAPLSGSKCEYCGTVFEMEPMRIEVVRPGMKRISLASSVLIDQCDSDAAMKAKVTAMVRRDMVNKIAEDLLDAVKFTIRTEPAPMYCADMVMVRGELWVAGFNPEWG